MNLTAENLDFSCPSFEIAAYIDGELAPERELEMDAHFAACRTCNEELTRQKQFLCTLNVTLKSENDFELPSDFARSVVTNAESTVSGLRRPRERFNAIFICASILLFVMFALGADAGRVLNSVGITVEQTAAVAGLIGHLVYSIVFGVGVILRTLLSQFDAGLVAVAAIAAAFFSFLVLFSRVVLRFRRT